MHSASASVRLFNTIAKREPAHLFNTIAKREPAVKKEDLGTLFSEFTKTIIEAIQSNNRAPYPSSSNPSTSDSSSHVCNFCGGPHFIRECLKVEELIREGKCKRNTDGKVVLPSGAFVPREIPGTLLSERIEEWHHQNPNQLGATSALLYSVEQPQLALTKPELSITSFALFPTLYQRQDCHDQS